MKLTSQSNKPFDTHPEYNGNAVCVDVTPPKTVQTDYGPKEQFRFVFETTQLRDDGKPYLVWSRGFNTTLGEKSALRAFLKQWFGRDLTTAEQQEFDTDTLIGRTAQIVIVHNDGRNGETYANIGLIRPDKSGAGLKPSGKYTRVKDRQDKDSSYNRVSQPASHDTQPADDWHFTKVHVGKHQGLELCELDQAAVRSLCENWMPIAKAMAKPLKADRDLMAALEQAASEMGIPQPAPQADDIAY
ncbi:MAG: hypothetical protein K9N47_25300 [Prosthecobacter sp.]|uniref:phage replication initiation protein, NGO0469 family n=1 Tax=Prosthecobacter sp. TaxID=1965333 RepID=UPI0026178357|nr:hypothetical protein [Prosthecobacter sp.]MCF7789464.1 hypothetical protein [Prosthecobacter sp.]